MKTAIILVGGLGTRLRPLTNDTPKPLLPVNGKPIVQHAVENAKEHGIRSFIFCVSYRRTKIINYFKKGTKFGVNIEYSIEKQPLGTGGAVKQAASQLDDDYILLWGDNLMDIDLTSMMNRHSKNNCKLTMALTPREDVENFGVAELDQTRIIKFVEKPSREQAPSNLINAGAFIMKPSALDVLPEGKSSIETQCFNILAEQGQVDSYIHNGQWFPTDTKEKYEVACNHFNKRVLT